MVKYEEHVQLIGYEFRHFLSIVWESDTCYRYTYA